MFCLDPKMKCYCFIPLNFLSWLAQWFKAGCCRTACFSPICCTLYTIKIVAEAIGPLNPSYLSFLIVKTIFFFFFTWVYSFKATKNLSSGYWHKLKCNMEHLGSTLQRKDMIFFILASLLLPEYRCDGWRSGSYLRA